MDKLRIGVFGGIMGVITSVTGVFLSWAQIEAKILVDVINVQSFIYSNPELSVNFTKYTYLTLFYWVNEAGLSVDLEAIIGAFHYVLVAATLIMVSIGIYGIYKLEPFKTCLVSSIIGFLSAIPVLLFMLPNTAGLIGAAVNVSFSVLFYAKIGFTTYTNIGLVLTTPILISDGILILIFLLFELSFKSAKRLTGHRRKTKVIVILVVIFIISVYLSFSYPYILIIPNLILCITYTQIAFSFHIIKYSSQKNMVNK